MVFADAVTAAAANAPFLAGVTFADLVFEAYIVHFVDVATAAVFANEASEVLVAVAATVVGIAAAAVAVFVFVDVVVH